MDGYDSSDQADRLHHLKWFFNADCMDIFWSFLKLFSVARPDYSSDERHPAESIGLEAEYPCVTLYRLTVSATVIVVGLTKATLSYLGSSTAANWVDWTFGVVITIS